MDLEDGLESDIIHQRYIELRKWEDIDNNLQLSISQVHRIHRKALENIEIIL